VSESARENARASEPDLRGPPQAQSESLAYESSKNGRDGHCHVAAGIVPIRNADDHVATRGGEPAPPERAVN